MDINMPEVNGFETIKRLKAHARYAKIPVIFLTGTNDSKVVKRGMELGAVDVVFKPISDETLLDCVERQLNPGKQSVNKPVILAVDDTPSILATIDHILSANHTVYTLPDPDKLKGLLKIIVPDLFLLDCQMPVLHGFDLIPIIRNHIHHEETPVIFLTSEGTIDNMSVAVSLGACDFIVKPINEALLRERVTQHLEGYLLRRRMRSL
jgi:PleD family two-component response regulator